MKKSVLALLLVAAMLLSGCACKHEWQEATCTTPKTCTKCDETEGEALGHAPGSVVYSGQDYVNAVQQGSTYCQSCNTLLDSSTEPITKLYSGEKYLFTPEEFSDRLNLQLQEISGNSYFTVYDEDSGSLGPVCGIADSYGDIVCATAFIDSNNKIDSVCKHGARDTTGLMIYFYDSSDTDSIAAALVAIVLTCDPSLDFDGAKACANGIVESAKTSDSYEKNGLSYLFAYSSSEVLLAVTIA